MMATQLSIHNPQATNTPNHKPHNVAPRLLKNEMDNIFHLTPFPHLHNNTISQIHMMNYHPGLSDPAASAEGIANCEGNFDENGRDMMLDTHMEVSTS